MIAKFFDSDGQKPSDGEQLTREENSPKRAQEQCSDDFYFQELKPSELLRHLLKSPLKKTHESRGTDPEEVVPAHVIESRVIHGSCLNKSVRNCGGSSSRASNRLSQISGSSGKVFKDGSMDDSSDGSGRTSTDNFWHQRTNVLHDARNRAYKSIGEDYQKLEYKKTEFQTGGLQTGELKTTGLQTTEFQRRELQTRELKTREFQRRELQTRDLQTRELQTRVLQTTELQTGEFQTTEFQSTGLQKDELQKSELQRNEFQRNEFQKDEFQKNEFHKDLFQKEEFSQQNEEFLFPKELLSNETMEAILREAERNLTLESPSSSSYDGENCDLLDFRALRTPPSFSSDSLCSSVEVSRCNSVEDSASGVANCDSVESADKKRVERCEERGEDVEEAMVLVPTGKSKYTLCYYESNQWLTVTSK